MLMKGVRVLLIMINYLLSTNRIETASSRSSFMQRVLRLSIVVTILITFIVSPSLQTANADYAFYKKWGTPATGNGQFSLPMETAVDSTGRVYVADMGNHRIQKFLLANACPGSSIQIVPGVCLVKKWGELGSGNGQFNLSRGVVADASGRVYVADVNNNRIQMFKGVGTFIRAWGTPGIGNGQFNHPSDIAVDSLGYVYVTDTFNHRIQKFQIANQCPAGTTQVAPRVCFVTKWGTQGTGNGQFRSPNEIAVDRQGNLYVAEWGNERVQKFQLANPCPAGTTQVVAGVCFVTKWGTHGTGNGQFIGLFGIAVDSQGNAYTTERANIRVQKFQFANPCPAGTTEVVPGVCFVTKWGTQGTGNGQFLGPNGIDVDSSGKVYVTDILAGNIQVFFWKTDVGGPLNNGTNTPHVP
jgi:tripartite motif-containing protein 71